MLFKRRGHSGLSIRTVCTDRKRSFLSAYVRKIASGQQTNQTCMYTSERKRSFRSVYDRKIASATTETNQTCMYTSFFKRERQYDPFGAKEIINRRILPQQTSQICIPRSLSVSDNMTRLERKKLSGRLRSENCICHNKQTRHACIPRSFKRERQYDPFGAKEITRQSTNTDTEYFYSPVDRISSPISIYASGLREAS